MKDSFSPFCPPLTAQVTFVACSCVFMYIRSGSFCPMLIYANILWIRQQICKSVYDNYHWLQYFEVVGSSKNEHSYRICDLMHGSIDINGLEIKKLTSKYRIYKFVLGMCINPLQNLGTSWKREFFISCAYIVWFK